MFKITFIATNGDFRMLLNGKQIKAAANAPRLIVSPDRDMNFVTVGAAPMSIDPMIRPSAAIRPMTLAISMIQ